MTSTVHPSEVVGYKENQPFTKLDLLAIEEPLEIILLFHDTHKQADVSIKIAITMRTPGMDFKLAVGFLFSEGIINHPSEIDQIKYCEKGFAETGAYNIVKVLLKRGFTLDEAFTQRNFLIYGSCGVCGKKAVEDVYVKCADLHIKNFSIPHSLLYALPEQLRATQTNFKYTGGIHACGFFDLSGNIKDIAEDIGRHNALDKLIGSALLNTAPTMDEGIILSGRAGFEMIQKAARAGIALVVSIGAPTSLAVETAKKLGITLVGFLKANSFNIYSHSQRITAS